MKALVFAIVLLAPALAHARHCRETSPVVGYSRCGKFGSRWSTGVTLAIEAGPSIMRFDAGARGRAVAYGGTFGERFHLGRWIYLGDEWTLASVSAANGVAARDTTMPAPAGGRGFLAQFALLVGTDHALGPLTVAVDTGPGFRIVGFNADETALVQLTFDARARAIAWLSPHWSIAAQASADLAHPGGYAFGVFVGGHIVAYDNTR